MSSIYETAGSHLISPSKKMARVDSPREMMFINKIIHFSLWDLGENWVLEIQESIQKIESEKPENPIPGKSWSCHSFVSIFDTYLGTRLRPVFEVVCLTISFYMISPERPIPPNWLCTAFTCANALALNFHFTNKFTPSFNIMHI